MGAIQSDAITLRLFVIGVARSDLLLAIGAHLTVRRTEVFTAPKFLRKNINSLQSTGTIEWD
ncbi:MAG: hypothetical protein WAV18_22080 [Roseiarcus sp.]